MCRFNLISAVVALLIGTILSLASFSPSKEASSRNTRVDHSAKITGFSTSGREWWLDAQHLNRPTELLDSPEFQSQLNPVTVAYLDTGVDYELSQFEGVIQTNEGDPIDGTDNDADGFTDNHFGANIIYPKRSALDRDFDSHGTVGATLMAGKPTPRNISGIGQGIRVLPVVMINPYSGGGSLSAEIKAIKYAINHGAKVINCSWGGEYPSKAERRIFQYGMKRGVWFVVAVGNDGLSLDKQSTRDFPTDYNLPNVLSVAATNKSNSIAYFSSYGRQSVDLAAPGQGLRYGFTDSDYKGLPVPSDEVLYELVDGTSFATPLVTGMLATYFARWGDPGYAQMRGIIKRSSTRQYGLSKRVRYGMLDMTKLLNTAPVTN